MKVRFLHEEEIELAALATLDAYGRRFGEVAGPPVPVEEILECDLELDFGFEDLRGGGFGADALGAMWVQERKVRVDSSLDPTLYPDKEGRYRFTMGHEIGHWQLHRHLFLADANQDSLFGASQEPSVICRAGEAKKPPIEWQADAFAGRLLMPREMVTRVWADANGGENLRFVGGNDEVASLPMRRRTQSGPKLTIVREMAKTFNVSMQAMEIRLTAMGLVRDHDKGSCLFG